MSDDNGPLIQQICPALLVGAQIFFHASGHDGPTCVVRETGSGTCHRDQSGASGWNDRPDNPLARLCPGLPCGGAPGRILRPRGSGFRSRVSPEKSGSEIRHIVLSERRRVARRIDGDEEGLDFLGLVSQPRQGLRHVLQVGRADGRTIGVAEEDQHEAAAKAFRRPHFAIVVDQLEAPENRVSSGGGAALAPLAVPKATAPSIRATRDRLLIFLIEAVSDPGSRARRPWRSTLLIRWSWRNHSSPFCPGLALAQSLVNQLARLHLPFGCPFGAPV